MGLNHEKAERRAQEGVAIGTSEPTVPGGGVVDEQTSFGGGHTSAPPVLKVHKPDIICGRVTLPILGNMKECLMKRRRNKLI